MAEAASIRAGTVDDVKYLDHVQRKFGKELGFLPTAALEAALTRGHVSLAMENGAACAYLLGRVEPGVRPAAARIYQAAVEYDARRRHIATALEAHFEAHMPLDVAHLGLWCAQDIDANLFWETCGFVAKAWRDGSDIKRRVHIFWEKDRYAGQLGALELPTTTHGGLLRVKRSVHLLLPGQRWTDVSRSDAAAAARVQADRHKARSARSERATRTHNRALVEAIRRGDQRLYVGGKVRSVTIVDFFARNATGTVDTSGTRGPVQAGAVVLPELTPSLMPAVPAGYGTVAGF